MYTLTPFIEVLIVFTGSLQSLFTKVSKHLKKGRGHGKTCHLFYSVECSGPACVCSKLACMGEEEPVVLQR